jgi:transcriptional regulator with XRE-family HTH domain
VRLTFDKNENSLQQMSEPTAEFARRLRQLRLRSGLTQEKLAERSELSRNYIGLLELEKREPSLSSLLRLATALSCSVDDLVGTPVTEKTPPFRIKIFEARKRQMLEAVQSCTHEELDLITQVVENCARLAGRRK